MWILGNGWPKGRMVSYEVKWGDHYIKVFQSSFCNIVCFLIAVNVYVCSNFLVSYFVLEFFYELCDYAIM